MITEPNIMIERKGIDPVNVKNYMRLLLTSNSEWVVPASNRSRRWYVLDVKKRHGGNAPFFAAIGAEMNGGGPAALFGHLLKRDLTGIDLRRIPRTTALEDQRRASWESTVRFWYECLEDGQIGHHVGPWTAPTTVADVHGAFLHWAEKQRIRSHLPGRDQFAKAWLQLLSGIRPI
jgi:hypothetical protein